MKKVKRMMFGGAAKAAGNAARNAAAKAPTPPPMAQKMMANLPKGSTVAGPGTGLAPKPTGVMGGIRNAVNNAAAKAPTPPPMAQKMMANLPRGSTVAGPGTGLAPKSGMTGLGTAAQANPKIAPKIGGMLGGGGAAPARPKIPATINTSRMLTGNPVTKTVRPFGMKEGGKVSSASSRADGCATKGKTKGKMV
jgi:hypothetical protein